MTSPALHKRPNTTHAVVDGSDPFYLGVELGHQKLSNGSVFPEADLNNPPTAETV